MKIAVFGGRFDPIHNGHLAVANEILKLKLADEVWLSVENQHQWRPIVASGKDRIAMMKLAIASCHPEQSEGSSQEDSSSTTQNDNSLHIDTTPLELGGLTETIKVIRRLREKYPQHEFIFVTGSDQPFFKWTHWDELEKEVTFLVVARKGFPLENFPKNCVLVEDPTYEPLEDSATRIREYLKEGKSITGLVPKSVEEYITKHELYK